MTETDYTTYTLSSPENGEEEGFSMDMYCPLDTTEKKWTQPFFQTKHHVCKFISFREYPSFAHTVLFAIRLCKPYQVRSPDATTIVPTFIGVNLTMDELTSIDLIHEDVEEFILELYQNK